MKKSILGGRLYQTAKESTFSKLTKSKRMLASLTAIPLAAGLIVTLSNTSAAPTGSITQFPADLPSAATTEIVGLVFRDFNANGVKETQEPGISGFGTANQLTATAYDDTNAAVSVATTDADGIFTLTGLSAATDYRVEISGLPSHLQAGASTSGGAESLTTFSTAGDNDILIGVNAPGDFCQSVDQVHLGTSCFLNGDAVDPTTGTAAGDTFVSFDYNFTAGSTVNVEATGLDTGATYGVAYDPARDTWYSSAYVKRHAGFGSAGIGGIYEIDSTSNTTLLHDNNNLTEIVRPDLGDTGDPSRDTEAFAAVGTMGLGDLEFDPISRNLYSVNLEQKQIDIYNVDTAGNVTVQAPFAIPDPGCSGGEHRPFALNIHDGDVFYSVTCDASTSQNAADLHGYIAGITTGVIEDFALDYDHFCSIENSISAGTACNENPAEDRQYDPWNDDISTWNFWFPGFDPDGARPLAAFPLVSDIEFDNDESLIIAIRDLMADKIGEDNLLPTAADEAFIAPANLVTGMAGGDLLRSCFNSTTGIYEIEGTSADPNCQQSLAGDNTLFAEYYTGEHYDNPIGFDFHQETSLGSTAFVRGQEEVVLNSIDPFGPDTGGTFRLSNTTGAAGDKIELYGNTTPGGFQKANGLGDIHAACQLAPVEIGNVLWIDTDNDGVYDPSEVPLPGTTVELLDSTGAVVATAITDANGNYIFTGHSYDHPGAWQSTSIDPDTADEAGIVPGGVLPNSNYTVRIDTTQSAIANPNYALTVANNGSNDSHDSDGVMNGNFAEVAVTTGGPGENNHTLDFGFSMNAPLASVGDYVWIDANSDGVQDAGELPLAGVDVKLVDAGGATLDTDTTDSLGLYLFEDLPYATYTLMVDTATLPAGYTQTFDNQAPLDHMSTVTLDGTNDADRAQDFGYVPTADVSVVKNVSQGTYTLGTADTVTYTVEVTNNGPADLTGITFTDNQPANVAFASWTCAITTATSGTYTESCSTASGNGNISETLTLNTGGAATFTITANVAAAATGTIVNTANVGLPAGVVQTATNLQDVDSAQITPTTPPPPPLASVGDYVWIDANSDGVQDAGELPLAGVDVKLVDAGGATLDTDTTDSLGLYLFEDLPYATYTLMVDTATLPAGYTQTFDNQAPLDHMSTVTLDGTNDADRAQDFGYKQTGSISGTAWVDPNEDFTLDGSEFTLEGLTVTLFDQAGVAVNTAVTDADGNYTFLGVCAGDYTIQISPPEGYDPSNDFDGIGNLFEIQTVTVVAGAATTGQNFTFVQDESTLAPTGLDITKTVYVGTVLTVATAYIGVSGRKSTRRKYSL